MLWVGTDDGYLWVTQERRQGLDERHRQGRPAEADVGGDDRGVAVRRGPGVRRLRRPPIRRRRAVRLRDRGLRRDLEVDHGQPARPARRAACARTSTNPNLLYCGTEFALFASLDRGESWTKINNNLPTVAVHEVAVHPTAGEIVAATHGRSLWILDVTALRQMATEKIKDEADAVQAEHGRALAGEPSRGRSGRRFVGENPPPAAHVFYSLPKKARR